MNTKRSRSAIHGTQTGAHRNAMTSKSALNAKYFAKLTHLAQSGSDSELARHFETLTVRNERASRRVVIFFADSTDWAAQRSSVIERQKAVGQLASNDALTLALVDRLQRADAGQVRVKRSARRGSRSRDREIGSLAGERRRRRLALRVVPKRTGGHAALRAGVGAAAALAASDANQRARSRCCFCRVAVASLIGRHAVRPLAQASTRACC